MSERNIQQNEKIKLLGIDRIENGYIVSNNTKIIVFEYLSNFSQNILLNEIMSLGLDISLKITKVKYEDFFHDLKNESFYDFSQYRKKGEGIFNINITDGYNKTLLSQSEINKFKINRFAYRHFLSIRVNENQNTNDINNFFLDSIKYKGIYIRKLDNEDQLLSYIKQDVIGGNESINSQYRENRKNNSEEYSLFNNFTFFIIQKIENIIKTKKEKLFPYFNKRADLKIQNLLKNRISIGDYFINTNGEYKCGILIQSFGNDKIFTREDINFLDLIHIKNILDCEDSIVFRFKNPEYYAEKINEEKKGFEKIYNKKFDETYKEGLLYIAPILFLKEKNLKLLDNKIDFINNHIGIICKMETILHTKRVGELFKFILGIDTNSIPCEKAYKKDFIKKIIKI